MTRSELLESAIYGQRVFISNLKSKGGFRGEVLDGQKLILDLLLAEQKRSEGCGYEQIDDDANIWKCDKCGEEWTFLEGGIVENNVCYCVACGLPIKRIITHDRDEDWNETTIITERDLAEGESV